MSLFRTEAPVLSRTTSIDGTQPGVSGQGSAGSGIGVMWGVYETVSTIITAASTNQNIFIADDYWQMVSVKVVFGTASTSGTLQIEHLTGTQAAGAGTNMLTGTVSLSGTANTVVPGTVVTSPMSTLQLSPGDRLGLVVGGTMTNLANCLVTIHMKRWQ